MAKLTAPAETAASLRVSERMLLFCVASNTDWKHTAIPGEIVTTMVVKGLSERDTGGALTPTDRGRAVLRQCCRTCDDDSDPAIRGAANRTKRTRPSNQRQS